MQLAEKYVFNGYWRDIGTRDAYYQANMDLLGPQCAFNLNSPNWPEPTWADFTIDDYNNLGFDFDEQTQANHLELMSEVINQMRTTGLKLGGSLWILIIGFIFAGFRPSRQFLFSPAHAIVRRSVSMVPALHCRVIFFMISDHFKTT